MYLRLFNDAFSIALHKYTVECKGDSKSKDDPTKAYGGVDE
jgi:hypothetical protein